MKHVRIALFSFGLAGLLLAALLAMQAPSAAQALPPRPTEAPPTAAPPEVTGGFIVLTINMDEPTNDVWTAVEWQDPHTDVWHLVDGWQGAPNANHEVRWYVGQEDLGSGPFRWLVYDAPEGDLLATSETFMLPEHARQTVAVVATLP